MKLKMLMVIVVLIVVCVIVALKMKPGSKEVIDQVEEEIQSQEEITPLNQVEVPEQSIPSQEEINDVKTETTTQNRVGSSKYKKPFNSSPNPSEYKEKLDNSLVLDSRLRPFAHDMAESMSEAKADKTKAQAVFDKFRTCAEADSSQEIFAVRASCAENLRTLSKLYPDMFETEYAEIEKRFPEEIKKSLF